ncbi:MAG: leucyl aminopeptidase [Planctomycetaceae bacterium]|nr:leucyl aminopeptidase [Planctomycetaceae bacterium]
MKIQATRTWNPDSSCDWAVVFLGGTTEPLLPPELPVELVRLVEKLQLAGDLPEKPGEVRKVYGLDSARLPRVLLVRWGTNSDDSRGREQQFRCFSTAARALSDQPDRETVWFLPDCGASGIQDAVTAVLLASQGQGIYRAEQKRHPYRAVTLVTQADAPEHAVQRGEIVGRAMNLTRELINRSPHEVNPANFADRAAQVASHSGLTCRIFNEQQLAAERMHSLLAVARGSEFEPRMVVLEYRGGGDAAFTGLVGKGVTYDSGGLSLKPSDSMKTMKSDMSGAATVLGVMQAIAALKLPVNVRGYMGLVENMISGRAYRLGDVLTARNGVTIEVLNTDAEGRLVLADVLCYAVDEGCEKLIDVATLTGSCVVALGEDYTGVFTNQQAWCDQFLQAANRVGEKVWQLPMCDSFGEQLRSEVADCQNVGSRWGGAITAAKFLEKFVADTPWVHLDIAGPAFLQDSKPYREGGATGVMLRTLLNLVETGT